MSILAVRDLSKAFGGVHAVDHVSFDVGEGEFLALIGTFKVNIPVATLATIGVILSACYALWLYRKVIFGVIEKPALAGLRDMGRREILVFAPLVILTILFGVYPKPVLDMSAASVAQLLENYQAAVAPKKAAEALTR